MQPYFENELLTIYHGDAREILPTLPKVGLVLTDPPYAINAGRGEWTATASVAIGLHEAAGRVVKGGSLVAFTTTSGRGIEYTQGAIGGRLPFNRLLTWAKTGGRSRAISPWRWDTVAILAFGRAPSGRLGESSVFTTPADYEKPSGHVAELPCGLAEWLYAPYDAPDLVTIDPFMGSGRLLEPALARGRHVIGIEMEERWCEYVAKSAAQPVGEER